MVWTLADACELSESSTPATIAESSKADAAAAGGAADAFGLAAASASISFSLEISSLYSRSMASFGSSLIFGLFLMFFALLAYLSVDMVSSKL